MKKSSLIFLIAFAIMISACPKEVIDGNSTMYGTWVRSNSQVPPSSVFPDTLWFSKKNGKNVLEFNYPSPSPIPSHIETEFIFRDGAFHFEDYSTTNQEMRHVRSFKWINKPDEFEIINHELFVFMSSEQQWTYKKVK